MTTVEAESAFPWLQAYWDTYGPIFGRPPGGESLADVAKRVYLFLGMLFRDRGGQRVLVVTHGGTLWMFRMVLERWTWEEAEDRFRMGSVPQCSVTDYEYDPAAGRLVLRDLTRTFWQGDGGVEDGGADAQPTSLDDVFDRHDADELLRLLDAGADVTDP